MIWGLLFFQLVSFSNATSLPNDLPPHVKSYYHTLDKSSDIKNSLFIILDSFHLPKDNEDLILPSCSQGSCYKHTPLTYRKAKEFLFGSLHLKGSLQDGYSLETYYCGEVLSNKDFGGGNNLAPNKIPNNNIVNTEHVWPQSRFNTKFSNGLQKADLHILFPEKSPVNSIRGNYPFGEVIHPINEPCANVALGTSKENERVFEPVVEVKGDVARATFYYVTRYKVKLDKNQEAYLRYWHQVDPVDNHERVRNERIFEVQKNRNPFVDMPELVEQISSF